MTMIEKMAYATLEALRKEAVYAEAVDEDIGKCIVDGGLLDMRIIVRAALNVLEPNEHMLAVGHSQWLKVNSGYPLGAQHRLVFTAMIQAALDEPKTPPS